jgi:hypothetical protein
MGALGRTYERLEKRDLVAQQEELRRRDRIELLRRLVSGEVTTRRFVHIKGFLQGCDSVVQIWNACTRICIHPGATCLSYNIPMPSSPYALRWMIAMHVPTTLDSAMPGGSVQRMVCHCFLSNLSFCKGFLAACPGLETRRSSRSDLDRACRNGLDETEAVVERGGRLLTKPRLQGGGGRTKGSEWSR